MSPPSVVSLLSAVYLASLPLIAVFTNMYPYMTRKTHGSQELQKGNWNKQVERDESLMVGVVINQFIIFIIGGLGNFLTLLAIPYVRQKYGSQFSILQLNSVVLILHLSLADLLYALLGFPNFLQVYFLIEGPKDEGSCYFLSMFRNLVAYVDFNTVAMISCCVARHNLCSQCEGACRRQDDHDKIFGGKRVYIICLLIWVVSFLTILPDVMGVTGTYAWSSSPFGCDHVCLDEGCSNIGTFISLINNIIFMIIFYAIILIRLCRKRNQVYGSETSEFNRMHKSISLTLSILIAAYICFILPVVATKNGVLSPKTYKTEAIIASIYWWIYGINVFIYLATSFRIREAYRKFLKDMWKKICKRSIENQEETKTETSVFWIGLRNLENSNQMN